jgi:hypothetical protein
MKQHSEPTPRKRGFFEVSTKKADDFFMTFFMLLSHPLVLIGAFVLGVLVGLAT